MLSPPCTGDGGLAYDPCSLAQNGKVFFGKVLRLDVDNIPAGKPYGIPSSNPFVNQKGVKPEIFALGLRNPWRCDYDSVKDTIVCGDVGQVRERMKGRRGRECRAGEG